MAVKAGEKRRAKGKAKDAREESPKPKRGRPKKEAAPVAKKRGRLLKRPKEKAVTKKPRHEGPKVKGLSRRLSCSSLSWARLPGISRKRTEKV